MRKYYSIFRPSIVDIGRKTLLMTVSGFALTGVAFGQEITVTGNLTSDAVAVTINPLSPFNAGNRLKVGDTADGSLTIEKGARVFIDKRNLFNDSTNIGVNAGTSGSILVTGAGSIFENTYYLNVGVNGSGTLTMRDGGVVTSNQSVFIGGAAGTTSSVFVTGAGSRLETMAGDVVTGGFGTGTLTIEDGGTVISASGHNERWSRWCYW
jgi:fibronectin-binding autotransporter adhesin